MKKFKLNNDTIKVKEIQKLLKDNEGYCPCKFIKNIDTKCMCKEFKNMLNSNDAHIGDTCHCGLYEIISE